MTDEQLLSELDEIGVVARVAPEDKVRLVRLLKEKGNVVAMTGDGVNDAPALKTADIGVAMGITGTEVSKEAAVMILTDDNFATIVGAVSYGRTLYDNLLKYLRFQMSTLVAYIAIFLGAGILGIADGAPLNPLQILWLNMVVDIPLAIALGFDQPARGLMARPPRPVGAPVLSRNNWFRLLAQGAVITVGSLAAYQIGEDQGGAVVGATMLLTTLSLFHVAGALLSRDQQNTIFDRDAVPGRHAAPALRRGADRDRPRDLAGLPAAHLRHHRPDLHPVVHRRGHSRVHRRRRGAGQACYPTPGVAGPGDSEAPAHRRRIRIRLRPAKSTRRRLSPYAVRKDRPAGSGVWRVSRSSPRPSGVVLALRLLGGCLDVVGVDVLDRGHTMASASSSALRILTALGSETRATDAGVTREG